MSAEGHEAGGRILCVFPAIRLFRHVRYADPLNDGVSGFSCRGGPHGLLC